MINKTNFEKLSKKNQAKKILFLLDNCLLDIYLNKINQIKDQLLNLYDYLQIYGNLNIFKTELNQFIYDYEKNKSKLNNLLLKIRYEILLKSGLTNFESDFVNYTKYGSVNFKKKDLIVLLDNIRSPFNAGSIIRSAEAFGFKSVILYGITAKIPFEKINRTSMNAEKLIEVISFEKEEELFNFINDNNFKITILEKRDEAKNLWEFSEKRKLIIVCGNEEFGVSEIFIKKADYILEIPQFGIKNSINVASAFSIAAAWISS